MYLFHEIEETEYFWADFIFGDDRNAAEIIEAVHRCLTSSGMLYRFYKGNDCQLNYTVIDRSSGKRWMLDLFEEVKAAKGKTARRHEYIVASYGANFALPGYAARCANSQIEPTEILFMLQFNGRWVLRRETFSLVVFFMKDGVLGAGEEEGQQQNLRRIVDLGKMLWTATSPAFCWMDVSPQLYSEAVEQISKGRVPSGAWFSISSGRVLTPEIRRNLESSPHLVFDIVKDGAVIIENTKCRRGKLRYF